MAMTATRRTILLGLLASVSVAVRPSSGEGQSAIGIGGTRMPRLITEIFLVDQDYGLAYGHNRVQALVVFVNDLVERYFNYEELPPKVVQSYYVDYYMVQVLNGDIHQFVWNSRWHALIVESVSAGLHEMGVHDQAILFNKVRDFVERDRARLNAFLESDYGSSADTEYMEALSKIGGDSLTPSQPFPMERTVLRFRTPMRLGFPRGRRFDGSLQNSIARSWRG
jgi:hypothetical protein